MNNKIFSGCWGKNHCQGMAMDTAHQYVYYSFTTELIKTDTEGNIIGTVKNIIGHLGCIDFNDTDGKLYGSLEYKNDEIGRGILRNLGIPNESIEDGFYIAIFDVDKIDRIGMDAEQDRVMKAVYLKTVTDDFKGSVTRDGAAVPHVYGCSGIDGLSIGPDFGAPADSTGYLNVCYGVYSDTQRTDNDHQVLLQYDVSKWWDELAQTLNQRTMHHCGPAQPRNRYFVYTGNTNFGVQNLEYDAHTGCWLMCVYPGQKPQFPNYKMFCIDGTIAPTRQVLKGCGGEEGLVLTLKDIGNMQNGISGNYFRFGSMGVYSMGNGEFYFVEPVWTDREHLSVYAVRYRLHTEEMPWRLERLTNEPV